MLQSGWSHRFLKIDNQRESPEVAVGNPSRPPNDTRRSTQWSRTLTLVRRQLPREPPAFFSMLRQTIYRRLSPRLDPQLAQLRPSPRKLPECSVLLSESSWRRKFPPARRISVGRQALAAWQQDQSIPDWLSCDIFQACLPRVLHLPKDGSNLAPATKTHEYRWASKHQQPTEATPDSPNPVESPNHQIEQEASEEETHRRAIPNHPLVAAHPDLTNACDQASLRQHSSELGQTPARQAEAFLPATAPKQFDHPFA